MKRNAALCKLAVVGIMLAPWTTLETTLAADNRSGKAIALSRADRTTLERYLGKGVVGPAISSNPLGDAAGVFPFKASVATFRFTSGPDKGKSQVRKFGPVERDKSGQSGRYAKGTNDVLFLHRTANGTVAVVSEQDLKEGVTTRYTPYEPFLTGGLRPGETRKMTIAIKVYDLTQPKDLTHTGSLDLTYSYLGAYKVTVPAGTYDAALLKWHYKGSVGPASIEDTAYRLFAKSAGVVAMVEKKNISAFLLYNDDSRYGLVLTGIK